MNAPPIEIRDATAADLATLSRAGEKPPPDATLVVLFHGEAAGWGRLVRDASCATLDLVIARPHRGLGLGKMLLAALEARAEAAGAEEAVEHLTE
ncbi:MAG TPA: GNAT family N-acetyltransferase, partial [Candidatus Thermoplasmatota archaeon]|nr:GNAT family N-acetyltransferase [Candidatus Thermoplasmatota archaeon]